jgi:uncharacterized protein
MKRLYIVLIFSLLAANTTVFADYQKGSDAALRGDFVTALKVWKPLGERGDATPQFQLGWLYYEGLGVTQNYKIALMWYKRSAEQGYAYAQSALGRMYEKGQAVSKDYIRAYMWFSIAASLWDTDARLMLNRVAKKMSRTQTEIAQRLARECETKVYKGC